MFRKARTAGLLSIIAILLSALACWADVTLSSLVLKVVINDDGTLSSVTDRDTGTEYAEISQPSSVFSVRVGDKQYAANSVRRDGDTLHVSFDGIATQAEFKITEAETYVALAVRRVTGPPIDQIDLLSLRLAPLPSLGSWINVAYGDAFGVCVCGGSPAARTRMHRPSAAQPWVDLAATATRETGLEGATAIAIGCPGPTRNFLDYMAVVEADFGMPSGARGRQSEQVKYSYLWVKPTVDTIDRLIEWAKRGGFRMMLFSYTSFSTSCGHYAWNSNFPNGMADLKVIADKIRAAGLAVGLHIHYNKAHKHDPYVSPVPDDRLHIARSFTLAEALDASASVVRVNENPEGCTKDDERRYLKIGKELVTYQDYTTQPPYEFRGCKRGALKSRATGHGVGETCGLLDVDTWPIFVRFDQDTDIQEETAGRIARICAETGPYDMIYFDGAEDVHAPYWYHCANSQWRVYQHIQPEPKVAEAAAATHFSWHMLTRSNAYDSVAPSGMKEFCRKAPCRTAPRRALDFTTINFGWLHGFARSNGDHITPDILEYVLSRGAAWNCPFSLSVDLAQLHTNPLTDDCFETIKIWEDARIGGKLTAQQKAMLKDLSAEHHLFMNEGGEYEIVPVTRIDGVAGGHAAPCYVFERSSEPDAAYAILSEPDPVVLTLDFPTERLKLMRPFGAELAIEEKAGKALVPVQSRRYLRFDGLTPLEAGAVLQRAKSSAGPRVQIWMRASDFVEKEGQIALGSEVGLEIEGALGDVIVPTGPGDMTGETPWYVDYEFEAKAQSRWHVWARCWYEDTSSNSLFLSAPGVGYDKERFGNSYTWKTWLWERGGNYRLPAGKSTLRFSVRESRPRESPVLDAICITNDPRYRPTDEDAREALGGE